MPVNTGTSETLADYRTFTARSEISGVFSKSLMSEWQVEFDLYVPEGTADDDEFIEIITQIHENSNTPISPSFCLSVKNGYLGCSVRGDSIPVNKWERHNRPTHRQSGKLLYLEKNRWYHVKSFVKEGYQYDMNPVTRVWVDSDLLFESYCPNCYNYKTTRKGCYNYLKFGIYKPSWRKMTEKPLVDKRIYYFDNYVVKV